MIIGKRKARVTIKALPSPETQDAHGQPVEAYSNLASNPTVWANIRTKPGGERFHAGGEQLQARLGVTLTLRYRSDISPKMIVLYNGRTFQIENAFDPTGEKKDLVLETYEVEL